MKKLLLSFSALTLLAGYSAAQSCTPVNCQADLTYPDLGGVCDTVLMDAVVNVSGYNDFESFLITSSCFDAGLIDPTQEGTDIKITMIDNFTYTGMPNGISGATNQPSYAGPSTGINQGCVSFTGTPTEIGVFNLTMDFLADVVTCGFLPIPLTDNAASYVLWLTVKPVPTFTGLATNYCITDGPVNMTVTGTAGGTFSGPGVTGNSFNPATAGVGTHEVMYLVSAQEGAAIAPAADSMIVIVEVFSAGTTFYQDADNDGFGDIGATATGCTIPSGFVSNSNDCDDSDPTLNPGEIDVPDNGIDEDCSGSDATLGIAELNGDMMVYPNPTTGLLTINLGNAMINTVQVLDLNGRIVNTVNVNNTQLVMNLSSLENGTYLLNVITTTGTTQKRVIVQH